MKAEIDIIAGELGWKIAILNIDSFEDTLWPVKISEAANAVLEKFYLFSKLIKVIPDDMNPLDWLVAYESDIIFEDDMDPIDWLVKYECIAKIYKWKDNFKLYMVRYFFEDGVASWFVKCDFNNWSDFVIKFKTIFKIRFDSKFIDHAFKLVGFVNEQREELYKLEKTHLTFFDEKIGGYSSMFIMTNVVGFVPAVLSCDIQTHKYIIFGIIVCIMSISSLHMIIYYVIYWRGCAVFNEAIRKLEVMLNFMNESVDLKKEVLQYKIELKTAYRIFEEKSKEANEIIKHDSVSTDRLNDEKIWFKVEITLQSIVAGLSLIVIILLLHPLKKFVGMEIFEVTRVSFAVWIFAVNVFMLAFKDPKRRLKYIEWKYGMFNSNS